ncbi:hypothetical protein OIDMADRAFT_174142 [Oidiodendron maius Zn]|uniref:Uncharacterized protein n=1 Tax=Oidiodendron maius (strain Zn) TaxID=913774 RepID=A0A0C3HW41_OIDMZ|nr:hypothetical protein OIDMADRAFT_174142 [Oidiodendron maius Zn]
MLNMGQSTSVGNNLSVAQDVLADHPPSTRPKDATYQMILTNQLQRTYDHMGQYLVAKGFLDAQLSEESQLLDKAASVSSDPPEVVLREDLQAIDDLLIEVAEMMRKAVFYNFVTYVTLISFSTLVFLTPLYERAHDNEIIQVIFVAGIASLVWTVILTLYDFFWLWQCRYIVRDLEAKFSNGVLLPEDRRKLKTRLWKCLR